jgi:hypothetical protein
MNYFQRRKLLKNINSLELVPVAIVPFEETSEGTVKLIIPKFSSPILTRMFISNRRQKTFNVKLDSSGSVVWTAIDGEKNIGYISKELKGVFVNKGESCSDCETLVVSFISKLYDEGFVTFRQLQ